MQHLTVAVVALFVAAVGVGGVPPRGQESFDPALFRVLTDISSDYSAQCLPAVRCQLHVYRLADPESSRFKLTFTVARIQQPFRVRVLDLRQSGRVADVFEAAARATGTAALINGGFFGFDLQGRHLPLGLVLADGALKRPKHPWTTGGVVTATQDDVAITPIRGFQLPGGVMNALQSKPMLVERGRSGIRSDDRALFDRSAFGLTQSGDAVLAGAFTESGQSASLKEFADLLLAWAAQQQVTLASVLAMDGGPGAHLYFPGSRQHFGPQVDQFVPNVIRVEAR